jgi:hypothetical protein
MVVVHLRNLSGPVIYHGASAGWPKDHLVIFDNSGLVVSCIPKAKIKSFQVNSDAPVEVLGWQEPEVLGSAG